MSKKFNVMRAAALLGAVGGATVFLGLGSAPASAGEQRLHNEFSSTYGLMPLFQGSGNNDGSSMKATKASTSPSFSRSNGNKADEPKREDPELPGYDGNGPDAPTAMKKR